MADAVTAAIGAIIMIGYIYLIAIVLAASPFWTAAFIGLSLMLWAFWIDDWKPLLGGKSE